MPPAPTPADALRNALRTTDDWVAALTLAQDAGPLGMDIIQWHRLRAGDGVFEEALDFLKRRSDWPGLALLRKNMEQTIPATAKVTDVYDYFAQHPPQTLVGGLRLAQAHRALGAEIKAQRVIQNAWLNFPAEAIDERAALLHFEDIL
ncbi:MAG: lytic transglycosylase domain-containing protein, partial [Pseudomonadota bacterium]